MQTVKFSWWWMLPLFLILALMVGAWLDVDGLWYDEVFTVKNAGGAQYGPLSPIEIYQSVQADDPYQAVGYPMTIALWGAFVGWSEFATRVSSLLFTLITMALCYRLGKDLISRQVGFLTALIYAFSSFTIFYAHELRAFSFTAMFATWLLWAYLRLLGDKPTRWHKFSFFLAGLGLLYAHYYAAMLLMGLGLYHLLFVKKNRLWFEITGLAFLMGLFFIPQIPAFLEGFGRYDPANVSQTALSAGDVLLSILYYLGNNSLILTGIALLVGLGFFTKNRVYRALLLITIFSTVILLLSNEILQIIEAPRLRYAIFLWSPLALWIAAGIVYLSQFAARYSRPLSIAVLILFPALWFGNALLAYSKPDFNTSIAGTDTPRFRTIINAMLEESVASDLFAFYNGHSNQAWYVLYTLDYSVSNLPMPYLLTASLYDVHESTRQWASEQLNAATRIWYGQNRTFGLNEVHDDFLVLLEESFVQCYVAVDNEDMGLELYARSQAFCPSENRLMQFDGIVLTGYEQSQSEDNLHLDLGWELTPDVPPNTYSLAVHITPQGEDSPILQADLGFAYQSFIPMQFDFELGDLPTGDYQIWSIVYDWQTLSRLNGQDSAGQSADRLLLGELRIEE